MSAEKPGLWKRVMGEDPRVDDLQEAVEELQEQLGAAVDQGRAIAEARDEAVARWTELEQENEKLREIVTKAKRLDRRMKKQQSEHEAAVAELEERLSGEEKRSKELAKKHDQRAVRLEKERNDARAEARSLEREFERAKKSSRQQVAQLQGRVEAAEEAVTKEREASATLSAEKARLEKELQGVRDELVEVTQRADVAASRIEEIEGAQADLQSRLEATTDELAATAKQAETAAANEVAATKELVALRAQHDAKTDELAELRAHAEELEGEVKSLAGANKKAEALAREREELAAIAHWIGRGTASLLDFHFDRPALGWRQLARQGGPAPLDPERLAASLAATTDDARWWEPLLS